MSAQLDVPIRRCRPAAIVLTTLFAIVAAPITPATAAAQQDPGTATLLPRGDVGWPRAFTTTSGARVLIYQPQVSEWIDQKVMRGIAALSYQDPETEKPDLGTVTVETTTKVSVAERLVNFSPLHITATNFPTLSREATKEIVDEIALKLPPEERVIALDRVLAQIGRSPLTPKNAAGIKTDPPVIFTSSSPAVLLSFDGEPIWIPIPENDLTYAVNTNWDVFQYGPTGEFYLRFEDTWLKSTTITGPWNPAGRLPGSFAKLPADANWDDVRSALPGNPPHAATKVFVTTEPAELIVTTGAPKLEPVAFTKLLWVSNSESDLFRLGARGPFYYLVTGRWFTSPTLAGPWEFASTSLPEDFRKIPREHPRSRVLASVPGTNEANEAVLLAMVPQTARVNRKEIVAPDAEYAGDPEFEDIPGTTVARATNIGLDVIRVGENYYLCYDGVWFVGGSPEGPWAVTDSVPGEIYEIPADSPAYPVTYVEVEEDEYSDDEWVTFACYAGYTGLVVAWGCAVWGSGWYYPPYIWRGAGRYPAYYPHASTYGYASRYNPWTGSYGTGGQAYGPYGGAAYGARYDAATGTYARGPQASDRAGARGGAASSPRSGAAASSRSGGGVYGSWGTKAVERGDSWARTSRGSGNAAAGSTRVGPGDGGTAAARRGQGDARPVASVKDNVYAGKDGNVYRKDDRGTWQKWDGGDWNSRPKPDVPAAPDAGRFDGTSALDRRLAESETYNQLDRDRGARIEGDQRTRDFGNYRDGSRGNGNAGSYRPSGGGSRVGGGGGARGGGGGRRRG